MHKKAILYSLIFICMIIFLASGCNKQKEPPKKSDLVAKKITPQPKKVSKPAQKTQVSEEKKDQQTPDATKGEEKAAETGSEFAGLYNPIGKIDPFAPLFEKEQIVSVEKTAGRRKRERRGGHLTPLEKVDLSQMQLLGVILASSGNRALVAETSGKGYVVNVGTYIGIASGRVVEILKDRIVVEEEVENILGKISLRKRELKLQKPPGEE